MQLLSGAPSFSFYLSEDVMSNTTTLDVMYSNFLMMYKAWQMALNAPGDVAVLEE